MFEFECWCTCQVEIQMCLLFSYLNASPASNGYKVILVSNRDEHYDRPTKEAHFWDDAPDILAGMDKAAGREGGTWLGISRSGRISCLLNILQPAHESAHMRATTAGRGFLVVDFLKGHQSGMEYLTELQESKICYNNYNLITLNKVNDTFDMFFYSNKEDAVKKLTPGFYGFGSCLRTKPYAKVKKGLGLIEDAVAKYGSTEAETELLGLLFDVMQDRETTYPDPVFQELGTGHGERFQKELSSIFVVLEPVYGTRTTTVILIDANNRVLFEEHTIKQPLDANNIDFSVSKFEFQIND